LGKRQKSNELFSLFYRSHRLDQTFSICRACGLEDRQFGSASLDPRRVGAFHETLPRYYPVNEFRKTLVAFMSFCHFPVRTTRAAQSVSEERLERTFAAAATLDMLVSDLDKANLSMAEDSTVESSARFSRLFRNRRHGCDVFHVSTVLPAAMPTNPIPAGALPLERDPKTGGAIPLCGGKPTGAAEYPQNRRLFPEIRCGVWPFLKCGFSIPRV
jgi:hypothetical protein